MPGKLAPMYQTESKTSHAASRVRETAFEALRARVRTRELLDASLQRIARSTDGIRAASAKLEQGLAHLEHARAVLRRIAADHPPLASPASADQVPIQA
jgi:hypothetical protein